MNLGKLPGIKGLVSNSHGRRRFKGDLTADMISPPLGDFRHTMHVGRGGDVFGDTSFLSNHGGMGGGGGDADSTSEKTGGFFSRTLRNVRKTPTRSGGDNRDLSPPPPPISPIIKNAISLPRLDVDTPNGCLKRELFPSSPSCPEGSTYCYSLESGFATLPRLSRTDGQLLDSSVPCSPEAQHNVPLDDSVLCLPRSDSMISFTVDLGPSLMSEVLSIIDSPVVTRETSLAWEEEEDPTSHHAAINSVTTPTGDPPCRMELNGKEISSQEQQDNQDFVKGTVPDRPMKFSMGVEPGMEAERFQRAADVLSRHYGGSGILKRQYVTDGEEHVQHLIPVATSHHYTQRRAPCTYPEEEDEIKV